MTVIKYILKSKSFTGSVIFGYKNDMLCLFNNESEMIDEQIKWLLPNLPLSKSCLADFQKKVKGSVEIVPPDTSFGAFWESYGKKINKKRCMPLWNKLKESDRIMCLMSLTSYDGYLKRANGRAKLDPENYLKRESYHTNWNTI